MLLLRNIALAILGFGTLATTAATVSGMGAEDLEHPEGISLRDESARSTSGDHFFVGYYGRSHRSGGLAGGK